MDYIQTKNFYIGASVVALAGAFWYMNSAHQVSENIKYPMSHKRQYFYYRRKPISSEMHMRFENARMPSPSRNDRGYGGDTDIWYSN